MTATDQDTIERFYGAFARGDGDTMAACYTPDARFDDPAFPGLKGREPGSMWRMLTSRGGDLKVTLIDHAAADGKGSAHWLADYTFTPTGRDVHNDVRSAFTFRDGLIAEQRDEFSFHAWSRQALGPVGLALGWTPVLRKKVQGQAREQLDEFIAADAAGTPS